MSFSLARRYRGASLAVAGVAVITSGALAVSATSSTAPVPSADSATSGPSTGGQLDPGTGAPVDAPGAPSVQPVDNDEPTTFIDSDTATDEVEGDERGVARSRTVEVDAAVLPEAAGEHIELPLFDDTTVVAELTAPTFRSEGGYRTWSGTVDGDEGSTVVLVEQDGALAGTVTTKVATYRLQSLPDGSTRIDQMDESQFPAGEELALPPADADTAGTVEGPPTGGPGIAADAGDPVVDVLVAYSAAAKSRKGGQAAMDADIALMIEQTNSAFSDSGINASVRLVHSAEVALNSTVDGTTLGRLANTSDGVYDELHVLRDTYGADLVALITDNPGGSACGIGYLLNNVSPAFAPYGFSVSEVGCATGNLSFTHELGHNFGASHDRGAWAGTAPVPYGYGWVNPQQGWRTVMAYANACPGCGRLLRFSNPDLMYNGAPMGAPAGAANAADNRSVLNMTASTVGGFRGGAVPASLTLTAPTAGQPVTASTKLVATWSTSGYLGSDATVELLRGSTVVKVLTAKVPLGAGRYEYLVPLTTVRAADYRLRVTPNISPAHAVTSDAFSVVDPVITPSFTAGATAGGTARVSWTYTGAPGGTVKVELVKDGKILAALKTGAVLGANGAGFTDVLLPAALNNGGGYQFRTTLSTVAKAPALTGTFSVSSSRQLVVTSPGDGGTLTAGIPTTVTWTAAGVLGVSVKAELLKGDVVAFTSAVAPVANGVLTFTPPAKLPTGTDYRIRLVAVSFPMVIATNDGRLSLNGSSFTLTSQSAPDSVIAGRPLAITWTTVGAPGTTVKLEAVSPTATAVIAASAPIAPGTYTWNVPVNLPRANWTVRATVVGNTLLTSTSAAATTVTWPTVTASASASGIAGAPVTVSWAFSDSAVAPVKVRLLQGTRVVATVTSTGVTAAGGTGSVSYRLPINLAAGAYQFDVSPALNAAIVHTTGDVPVTLPTLTASGAASVARGQTAAISWAFSGGASVPVRIDLVQGTKVILVKSGAVSLADGTGSFAYKAPTTLLPGTYTVRIRPALLATSAAVQGTRSFTVS